MAVSRRLDNAMWSYNERSYIVDSLYKTVCYRTYCGKAKSQLDWLERGRILYIWANKPDN